MRHSQLAILATGASLALAPLTTACGSSSKAAFGGDAGSGKPDASLDATMHSPQPMQRSAEYGQVFAWVSTANAAMGHLRAQSPQCVHFEASTCGLKCGGANRAGALNSLTIRIA